MALTLIAAVARNLAIGKDGKLLCSIPGDLKRFKSMTLGNTVLMGRKTFDSLPVKPLKDRTNIVITRNEGFQYHGVITAHSMEEALEIAGSYKREVFSIGGAEIYEQTLGFADRLELTEINKEMEGDVFFPEYKDGRWTETKREVNGWFDYVSYQRNR